MKKNSKTSTIDVGIDNIYFTHSRIYHRFSGCSELVENTLQQILDGTLRVEDLPIITVIPANDGINYFSLNNRRLWVFKELFKAGKISNVKARLHIIKRNSSQRDKYSIDTCSKTAKIMRSKK